MTSISYLCKKSPPWKVWTSQDMYNINIGSEMRGMAILTRKDFLLTNINLLPSGRAVAAVFSGIRLINVYAPSGKTRRTERESFFKSELLVLFSAYSHPILIEGFQLHTAAGKHHGHFNHQQNNIGDGQWASAHGHVDPGPITPQLHTLLPQRGHRN